MVSTARQAWCWTMMLMTLNAEGIYTTVKSCNLSMPPSKSKKCNATTMCPKLGKLLKPTVHWRKLDLGPGRGRNDFPITIQL